MRLFAAINFSPDAIENLMDISRFFREYAQTGNFSRRENLHLTLAFLGEVPQPRVKSAVRAMDIEAARFNLEFSGPGIFKRPEGDILWMGTRHSRELMELQNRLSENFRNMGFDLESRRFSPHITLARQVNFQPGFDIKKMDFKPFFDEIGKISLMKSERINGKLTYTEIFKKDLIKEA